MKKLLYILFLVSSFDFLHSRQNKHSDALHGKLCKKHHEVSNVYMMHRPGIISFDGNKDMSEALNHLKRRYPRKYNSRYNIDKLEQDDFGYNPLCARQKKAYKI